MTSSPGLNITALGNYHQIYLLFASFLSDEGDLKCCAQVHIHVPHMLVVSYTRLTHRESSSACRIQRPQLDADCRQPAGLLEVPCEIGAVCLKSFSKSFSVRPVWTHMPG